MSTNVYSHVLIYTAESTRASMERTIMPNLRNGIKRGFDPRLTWLQVRHSTAELQRSTLRWNIWEEKHTTRHKASDHKMHNWKKAHDTTLHHVYLQQARQWRPQSMNIFNNWILSRSCMSTTANCTVDWYTPRTVYLDVVWYMLRIQRCQSARIINPAKSDRIGHNKNNNNSDYDNDSNKENETKTATITTMTPTK